jgi:hypothetical protein
MRKRNSLWSLLAVASLTCECGGQGAPAADPPFELNVVWGNFIGSSTDWLLGRVQFTNEQEAWAVAVARLPPGGQGMGLHAVVYTRDAGRTWIGCVS